jgi:hypothetical protein
MAVSLTPALSQREREIKERAARDFHGKAAPTPAVAARKGNDLYCRQSLAFWVRAGVFSAT